MDVVSDVSGERLRMNYPPGRFHGIQAPGATARLCFQVGEVHRFHPNAFHPVSGQFSAEFRRSIRATVRPRSEDIRVIKDEIYFEENESTN